ncbi:HNH endonuclease [Candidatus Poribacteria bacterium]|nr:HNH endonuclease [Candidatus Poribacteria bacterium]
MSYISVELRRLAIQRAAERCEYCGLSQEGQEATFHIDHVIPVAAGGATVAENLALACVSCSLRKAARQTTIDPQSGKEVALYNPRRDSWREHFRWEGVYLVGLTATGRATIEALDMNRTLILAIRQEEVVLGRHPLPDMK